MGNTLILFDGYPTAIADMELYDDYEGLFSILIHELFHGNQYIKSEKRFPDEMLGITYPFTYCEVGLKNIKKLLIVLKNKPLETGDSLLITGIGEIKGQYTIQGDTINLVVN
ncbi:hypothetical protein [Priestia aryabhattai]|uniref:hypothetical protein n=1 Tax=Priestia aryabhattai TaxID=412384 RepID=UPI003D27B01E